ELLSVVGGFAVFFFIAGILAGPKIMAKLAARRRPDSPLDKSFQAFFGNSLNTTQWIAQMPALSAILPFALLMMISARLPLANPSPVFGLAMLLVVLLLALALLSKLDALIPV